MASIFAWKKVYSPDRPEKSQIFARTKMGGQTLGYDFTIEYKKGSENSAADAFSWLPTVMELSVLSLFLPLRLIRMRNYVNWG